MPIVVGLKQFVLKTAQTYHDCFEAVSKSVKTD